MPGFDVLSASSPLGSSAFIEASAGTGKSFAIEMLVARLIGEEEVPLEKILVVTFTKAATWTLKNRIRETVSRIYLEIKNEKPTSPWVHALIQNGKERAVRNFRSALFSFDALGVYTIHSFCGRLLQEFAIDACVSLDLPIERSAAEEMESACKDFLRQHLSPSLLLPIQFEKVLGIFRGDFDSFIKKIVSILSSRKEIEKGLTFASFEAELRQKVFQLNFSAEELKAYLLEAVFHYKGLINRQKEPKQSVLEAIDACVSLATTEKFSVAAAQFLEKGEPLLIMMAQENRVKKSYHALDSSLRKILCLLAQGVDPLTILATLAGEIKKSLDVTLKEEELFFFEDLVIKCSQLVKQEKVSEQIQKQYQAVLIDEFQDTDELQWEIFSHLFCDKKYKGLLYLVGDPKQAIYRFRGADIYTYLKAKQCFDDESLLSLNVNYRSTKELIKALNRLLMPITNLFYLPQEKRYLGFPEVYPNPKAGPSLFDDERGSLHFFVADERGERSLFTFIVQEILTLNQEQQISLSECAVLVSDRFQANRFLTFCKGRLPVSLKRTSSLIESEALDLLIEIVEATLNPKDLSLLLRVLGGPLFFQNESELKEVIHSGEKKRETIKTFYLYKECLENEGILPFFMLWSSHLDRASPLFFDLLQLIELTSAHVSFLDGYLPYLESLKKQDPEKEELKRRQQYSQEAVQVQTIHTSKGLEYDIVFPLGLISSPSSAKTLSLTSRKTLIPPIGDPDMAHLGKEELEAERMRLFYVAITRARKRLYFPIDDQADESIANLFLSKLIHAHASASLADLVHEHSQLSLSSCPEKVDRIYIPPVQTDKREDVFFNDLFPMRRIHSFSTISEFSLEKSDPSSLKEGELPSGVKTGLLLHHILETLDFNTAFICQSPQELKTLILPFVSQTSYLLYIDHIVHLCYAALHANLGGFSLNQVEPNKILREMEVLYISDAGQPLKGVIDLFFEYQGNYYLIDWKSNLLSSYSQEMMMETMERHDYFLQEKIYREALLKYLALFSSDQFGGSYYVFLRGLPEGGVMWIA
ncbi:MAG: UvrD-helicase domain-containing protein [Chlamydiia bacterium]|nr:UvrD-helicase domain-containing protein [Chlamydiia bacterium]